MSHTDPIGKPPQQGDQQYEWDWWYDRLLENIYKTRNYEPVIDPASVAANSEDTQTFTVNGLTTTDVVIVNKPTKTTDLSILDAFVSAADTLSITFRNFSGSPIDAGPENYRVIAIQL